MLQFKDDQQAFLYLISAVIDIIFQSIIICISKRSAKYVIPRKQVFTFIYLLFKIIGDVIASIISFIIIYADQKHIDQCMVLQYCLNLLFQKSLPSAIFIYVTGIAITLVFQEKHKNKLIATFLVLTLMILSVAVAATVIVCIFSGSKNTENLEQMYQFTIITDSCITCFVVLLIVGLLFTLLYKSRDYLLINVLSVVVQGSKYEVILFLAFETSTTLYNVYDYLIPYDIQRIISLTILDRLIFIINSIIFGLVFLPPKNMKIKSIEQDISQLTIDSQTDSESQNENSELV